MTQLNYVVVKRKNQDQTAPNYPYLRDVGYNSQLKTLFLTVFVKSVFDCHLSHMIQLDTLMI